MSDMVTGGDAIVTKIYSQVVAPDSVPNTDPLANPTVTTRTNQQRLLPTATQPRFIAVVQQFETTEPTTFSEIVPTGYSLIITSETFNPQGNLVQHFIYRQLYIGNIAFANMMPEQVSSALFPHYDWNSLYDNSYKSILNNPGLAVSKTQVRNNASADTLISVELMTRYISNNASDVTQPLAN